MDLRAFLAGCRFHVGYERDASQTICWFGRNLTGAAHERAGGSLFEKRGDRNPERIGYTLQGFLLRINFSPQQATYCCLCYARFSC
jgi:hypothetical protein